MRIAFLFNRKPAAASSADERYCEWDTPETVAAVAAALRSRHEVIELDCHPDHLSEIIARLGAEQPELCFNMAEGFGPPSREAQIPALLDMLGLNYTASDPLTLAIALDKARTKEVLAHHRIPSPVHRVIDDMSKVAAATDGLDFPLIVKPVHEGSSKGIFERSVVHSQSELERQVREVLTDYRQPAIVETFLPGREFTVALLGNGDQVEVLPIVEISFDCLPEGALPFYSYEAKWIWDDPAQPIEVVKCPAPIQPELRTEIEAITRRAYAALRCRDWARIDVRLDANGQPQILELNPLPGVLPDPREHSAFPMAAREQGMSYEGLILRVVEEATRRYHLDVAGTSNTVPSR
jgi:D-alanine-D-alanine ligase